MISNGIKCHILSPLATYLTKAKLVWHVRDMIAPGFLREGLRITARLFCRLVVANSSAVSESMHITKTVVIHNGIDLTIYRSGMVPLDKEKDLSLPSNACLVGAVGHFAPIKGFDTLIKAAPKILERLPNAHFLIAGGAVYETHRQYSQRLAGIVKRSGLADRVHFLGFRDDIPRLLSAFDVFVSASYSEGFGRAIAEAMAVNCPVVATAVGGVPEIIDDGINGLLIPPGEPEILARCVVNLLNDKELRARLVREGRRKIRAWFDLEDQSERFRTVMLSILPEKKRLVAAEQHLAA